MAIVTFEATGAVLFSSVGEFEKKHPGLSFRVQLTQGESIKLASEEKFEDLDGHVTIFPETQEIKKEKKGFGTLYYFAGSEGDFDSSSPSFILEAIVTVPQFEALLSAANQCRIPLEISADIEGMNYDWQPDGSGKKWDNKTSPKLSVNSVRFSVPLTSTVSETDTERRPSEDVSPPTQMQLNQLSERLIIQSGEITKWLKAIFWALAVVGVLILLRKL